VDSAVAGKFACNGGKSRPDLEKLSCVFSRLSANSRTGEQRNSQAVAGEKSRPAGESQRTSGRKNRSLRYAEVVIAELVPEAGTVALLGAGLG
jgi:hypothetical protein